MERTSFNVFLGTIALSIIAFLPTAVLPFGPVKTVIIGIGILASFLLYLISRMKAGSLSLPLHPVIILGGFLGLSVIASVIFSASPGNSFMGIAFDQYSGAFILTVLLAGLLAVLLCKTRERIASVIVTIIGSFALAALFTIVRFIGVHTPAGAGFLGLGAFTTITSTMVGSWYDLAIIAGVVFIVSSFTLEFFSVKIIPVSKRLRLISIILCAVSFIFLVLIDLSLIWIGIALAALGLVAYRFFSGRKMAPEHKKNLPYFALVILVVAALFAWKGNVVSGPIIEKLNLSYAEVSLPWQSTLDIASPTLKQSPLFGTGPDRFSEQYLLYKDQQINQTQFWNVTFPSGSNFILTSLVDQGIVGFLLWVLLFGWFFVAGVRALRHPPENALSQYSIAVSFLSTLFLWSMLFLYAPSHAVILVVMVMTGLFIAVLGTEFHHEHASPNKPKTLEIHNIAWSQSWKWGSTAWLALWLMILVSVAGCFVYAKNIVAQVYFQSGVNAATAGDADGAHAIFEKALLFEKSDSFYQALAQTDAYEINTIVSSTTQASSSTVSTIGSLLNEGINFSRSGRQIDPVNADNYLDEGDISAIAAALNVPNAYVDSRTAYINAIGLSPMDPSIYLSLARLDYAEGSTTAAASEVTAALQLKPDYTDALFEAGVISYNAKNYQTAAQALEAALKADRTYVNAEYLLGLTFARANDTTDAISVFTDLSKTYPQNTTISTILSDLQNGTPIFSDANQQSQPAPESAASASAAPKVSALSKPAPKNAKPFKPVVTSSSTSQ